MDKKKKYFFPFALFLFYVIELWLVKSRLFQVGIIVYFLFTFFLYNVNEKYIISFFVFSLPLAPIITTDYKLASFIGPHEIIYGFSLFVLSRMSKRYRVQLNKYQKVSIRFVYFLFFIHIYIIVKDIIIGVDPDKTRGVVFILKRFIRYFLYYRSVVLLIRMINFKGLMDYTIDGIKYAVFILPVSMYFTVALILLGAGVSFAEKRKDIILSGDYQRYVGFYHAGGDENSAGIFLAMALGFFLAIYEKDKKIRDYILFMGMAILGILMTGSRTAFLAMATILLIFLILNNKGKIRFGILSSIIIFYYLFQERLNLVIQRFLDPSAKAALDADEMGRVGKWIYYLEWIYNHPLTFLFGNQEVIPLGRAPHNFFIFLLYHAGIMPLIIFMILLYQLFSLMSFKDKPGLLRNVYYILPSFFILMSVNSFGSSIYLWLYLPLGVFYLYKHGKDKNENLFVKNQFFHN